MAKILIDREQAIKVAVEQFGKVKGVTQFDAVELVDAMEAIPVTSTYKTYHCKVQYDNGATVKIVELVVFAMNEFHASNIIYEKLCKHHDESIRSATINEITLEPGVSFVLNS